MVEAEQHRGSKIKDDRCGAGLEELDGRQSGEGMAE